MAYDSSELYLESMYPHSHALQASASSLLPPFYLDSVASARLSAPQDFTYTALLPATDVSTPSADSSFSLYPNYSSVPDPYLYYWPFWDPWNPWNLWETNYWFHDSQEYPSNYSLAHQTVGETVPFASTQDALQYQYNLPYLPESTSFGTELIDLSFLKPDERYIVQSRMRNEKWRMIQNGYNKYWKPMTISGLAMKLGRIRKRNRFLEQVIPAKPRKRSRTSSTSYRISSHS